VRALDLPDSNARVERFGHDASSPSSVVRRPAGRPSSWPAHALTGSRDSAGTGGPPRDLCAQPEPRSAPVLDEPARAGRRRTARRCAHRRPRMPSTAICRSCAAAAVRKERRVAAARAERRRAHGSGRHAATRMARSASTARRSSVPSGPPGSPGIDTPSRSGTSAPTSKHAPQIAGPKCTCRSARRRRTVREQCDARASRMPAATPRQPPCSSATPARSAPRSRRHAVGHGNGQQRMPGLRVAWPSASWAMSTPAGTPSCSRTRPRAPAANGRSRAQPQRIAQPLPAAEHHDPAGAPPNRLMSEAAPVIPCTSQGKLRSPAGWTCSPAPVRRSP
jgi:hypothetical protein